MKEGDAVKPGTRRRNARKGHGPFAGFYHIIPLKAVRTLPEPSVSVPSEKKANCARTRKPIRTRTRYIYKPG